MRRLWAQSYDILDSSISRILHASCSIIFIGMALSGCGMSGGAMSKVESDPALVTGSVPPVIADDQNQLSDEITIRNAVSSANLEKMAGQQLAWANQDTGSRGTVTRVVEAKEEGQICRKFDTSRESFEGIALFAGKTCLKDDGEWSMMSFGPV